MKKEVKSSMMLLWLCWLIYACSYTGKVNYTANINQIMAYYHVDHSAAGLASTFFFFAYAIGQVINGLFCKKYNLKWMIFFSLITSGIINFVIGISDNFSLVQYLWLVNGFSMSILWPTLIRALSENLGKEVMPKASVVMGTTVAAGTFFIYGLSSLLVKLDFKLSFYIPAGIFLAVAFLWLCAFPKLVKKAKEEINHEEAETFIVNSAPKETFYKALLFLSIGMLAFYGVATNLIKDGLVTWVPSILKEQYELDSSFSIILTLALPAVAIFANAFAVKMHNKVSDYVIHSAILFLGAGILIACVIIALPLNQFVLTLLGFTGVCFLISSSNSLITSIFPLFMKGKVNSGLIAGILNGCCYLGSTLSSYGLGVIADECGWNAVFGVLLTVCIVVCLSSVFYLIAKKMILNKNQGGVTASNLSNPE